MAAPRICLCHLLKEENKSKIHVFSAKTWHKFVGCANEWVSLDGYEQHCAEVFVNKGIKEHGDQDGFHLKCYQRFTDRQRLEYAKKRRESGSLKRIRQSDQDNDNLEPPLKRMTRSQNESLITNQPRVKHILPPVCLIGKKLKCYTDKFSGKRLTEKLVLCETECNALMNAAINNEDENILFHVRDKDPIAVEVNNHKSCYRSYIKKASQKQKTDNCASQRKFDNSFDVFCENIIETRFKNGKETIPISKLNLLFVRTVMETEHIDASGYTNQCLKKRILKRYPSIKIIQGSHKNECEVVFFDHEVLVDNLELNSLSSELSEECESEVADIPQIHSSLQSELRDAFTSSQYFKRIIQNTPNLDAPWPPTSNEIHLDSARKLVPLELFNFMAWLTGTSCDPTFENRVQIGSDTERKLLSICQDIIHLACRDRKQIPKHLALAMTVRHLTGSSTLLQLLNKLGHSASHSTILEHDAALASLQIQNNDSVPQGFTKNTFTTLVWNNNDLEKR